MDSLSNKVTDDKTIGIIGLGYVGLPLGTLFSNKYPVIGYDINEQRVMQLNAGLDLTGEVSGEALTSENISFTTDASLLRMCDVIIVTVPTDINRDNQPDLEPLKKASATAGRYLKDGAIVVFESTVYPGLTDEICIPIIEETSGKKWKTDFFVGYSPERINPGDKDRPLRSILKIVSGDTPETLETIACLYGSVIDAGIYRAENIRTAEAAKVIENAQRDLNIAFVNELALIFDKMGLDTRSVLEAAGTKWNFLKFEPGLVGGHCIGVDPYYLTHKAEALGYVPEVIHSGRRVNNGMAKFIAEKVVKTLIKENRQINMARVLLMGVTFKENVPDTRNSKAFDIIAELTDYGVAVDLYDPLAESNAREFRAALNRDLPEGPFDAVILAVRHDEFRMVSLGHLRSVSANGQLFLFDLKGFYDRKEALSVASHYWRL
ncbi:MAG TPA: nucleotide sugar dehydrogenase [Sphingobacteriaceae bacterium]